MKFVNTSKENTVKLETFNIVAAPGEVCDVPDGYSWPMRASNGSRLPSTIESLAPHLKPADPKVREAWERVPPVRKAERGLASVPSVQELVKQGLPPGVAEAEHRKALAMRGDMTKLRDSRA